MQTRTGAEDRAKVTSILCKARGVIWKRFPSTIRPVSLSLKMTTTMNETLAPAWWEYHLDVAAPALSYSSSTSSSPTPSGLRTTPTTSTPEFDLERLFGSREQLTGGSWPLHHTHHFDGVQPMPLDLSSLFRATGTVNSTNIVPHLLTIGELLGQVSDSPQAPSSVS